MSATSVLQQTFEMTSSFVGQSSVVAKAVNSLGDRIPRALSDRGMYGVSSGGVAVDLQAGLGLWPRFGQQPHPAPELAPVHQPPQSADAVVDQADSSTTGSVGGALMLPGAAQRRLPPPGRGRGQAGWRRIRAAADSASQCREIRSGPVLRVLCHCQPALLSILKPGSIQKRSAYQLAPASPGAWPVNMVHGSSCSAYQTTIRVQRRFTVASLNAVPRPIHPVSGRETKVRAGRRRPPSAQKAMFLVPHV